MVKEFRGFTLIELLVVVLIIGILAAVAIPQYQKGTAKAKATQILTFGRAFLEAQNIYYLANGQYSTNLNLLDITPSLPAGWNGYIYPYSPETDGHFYLYNTKTLNIKVNFVPQKEERHNIIDCFAASDDTTANTLCIYLTGTNNAITKGTQKEYSSVLF